MAILPPLRERRGRLAYMLTLVGILTASALPLPKLYRRLIDGVMADVSGKTNVAVRHIVFLAICYIALVILRTLLGSYQRRVNVNFAKDVATEIRTRTLACVFETQVFHLETSGVGKTISIINRDSKNVADLCCNVLVPSIADLMLVGLLSTAMVIVSWPLAIFAIATVPMLAATRRMHRSEIRQMQLEMRTHQQALSGRLSERVRHVRLVKHAVKLTDELKWFSGAFLHQNELEGRIGIRKASVDAVNSALTAMSGYLFLGVGGYLILTHEMTLGKMSEFLGYSMMMQGALTRLINLRMIIDDNAPAVECLYDYYFNSRIKESNDGIELPALRGEIELEEVHFTYPVQPGEDGRVVKILHGASLRISAGEMVAVIGGNGCGKSTIAALLLRFYEPDAGRILVDGYDVRQFSRTSLRAQLGLSEQASRIFKGSILESVTYVNSTASRTEAEAVVATVGLDKVVAAFPKGMNSMIGEDGVTLSSGQRQRLSLARTLLHRPKIMILDEAFSSVDIESEMRILGYLKAMPGRPTILAITHNHSTLHLFDRVYELRNGRLTEVRKTSDVPMNDSALIANAV